MRLAFPPAAIPHGSHGATDLESMQ